MAYSRLMGNLEPVPKFFRLIADCEQGQLSLFGLVGSGLGSTADAMTNDHGRV